MGIWVLCGCEPDVGGSLDYDKVLPYQKVVINVKSGQKSQQKMGPGLHAQEARSIELDAFLL